MNWPGGIYFVEDEKRRQRQWEEMTGEEYEEAGRYFDLMEESHSSPSLKTECKSKMKHTKRGKRN